MVLNPVGLIVNFGIVRAVAWIMETRLRMLLCSAAFGALGYYAFYTWGELAAAMAWVPMAGLLFFAAIKSERPDG